MFGVHRGQGATPLCRRLRGQWPSPAFAPLPSHICWVLPSPPAIINAPLTEQLTEEAWKRSYEESRVDCNWLLAVILDYP